MSKLHPDVARALVLMFTDAAEGYVRQGKPARAEIMVSAAKAAASDTPEFAQRKGLD